VSRGKVSRSAKHPAVPAPTNFTAADGGTSVGPNPTISQNYCNQYEEGPTVLMLIGQGEEKHIPFKLLFSEGMPSAGLLQLH